VAGNTVILYGTQVPPAVRLVANNHCFTVSVTLSVGSMSSKMKQTFPSVF